MTKVDSLEKKVSEQQIKIGEQGKVILDLQTRSQKNEQYLRRRQLEICGVAETPNEDPEEIFIEVAKKVGVAIQPNEIDAIHRLVSRTKPAPIIVELNSRRNRDKILLNKKGKKIKDKSGKNLMVYESLSSYFKTLLWKAKMLAREKNYAYTWFSKNKVLVKKDSEAKTLIFIESESDLIKIV